jgi:hypothetical protein
VVSLLPHSSIPSLCHTNVIYNALRHKQAAGSSSNGTAAAAAALAAQEAAEDAEASLNCTAAPMFYRDRLSECQRAEADTHQVCMSPLLCYIVLLIITFLRVAVLAATRCSSVGVHLLQCGSLQSSTGNSSHRKSAKAVDVSCLNSSTHTALYTS